MRYIQFSATISIIFDLQASCSEICSAWIRSIDSLPHFSMSLYFSTYECLYLSCFKFKFPLCTSFLKMVSAVIIDWLRGIRDDLITAVISGHDPQGHQSFKMRAIIEEQTPLDWLKNPKRIILIKDILHR